MFFTYAGTKWIVPWRFGWAVAVYWIVSRTEDVLYGIGWYLSRLRAILIAYMGVGVKYQTRP